MMFGRPAQMSNTPPPNGSEAGTTPHNGCSQPREATDPDRLCMMESKWHAFYDEYPSGDVNILVQKGDDASTCELLSSIPAEADEDPAFNPDFDKLLAAAHEEAAWRNARDEGVVISRAFGEVTKKMTP